MVSFKIKVKDSDGTALGEFDTFRNLQFSKVLNNYGTASFEVPAGNTKGSSLVFLRKYTVEIFRVEAGDEVLVWAGEQAIRRGNLTSDGDNWVEITCYDWLEQLNARYTEEDRVFDQIDAGEIAWELIDRAQDPPSYLTDVSDPVAFPTDNDGAWTFNTEQTAYESFVSPTSKFVATIAWLIGRHYEGSTAPDGDITVGIYADSGGAPGAPIAENTQALNNIFYSNEDLDTPFWKFWEFTEDDDIQLVEGDTYWVGVKITPLDTDTGLLIYLADGNPFPTGLPSSTDTAVRDEMQDAGQDWLFYLEFTGSNIATRALASFGITRGEIEETELRDREYKNQNVMQAITDLTSMLNGFDFEISNQKVFNVYLAKGTVLTDSVRFEYGFNVQSIEILEDFSRPANQVIVVGEMVDATDLTRIERDDTDSQAIFKIREQMTNSPDVADNQTFEEKGDAFLRKYNRALLTLSLDILESSTPNITDFVLGDLIAIKIVNGLYDIDSDYRVFGWAVSFSNDGAEKLTLTLGDFTLE